MIERSLNLEIETAYAKLKSELVSRDCRVVAEEAPRRVAVEQGSLWGVSPRAAKKTIQFDLAPADSGTRISIISKISSDWTKMALTGCVLAVLVALVCFWISMDLSSFASTGLPTYWSWLVTADGYPAVQLAQSFADLTKILAVFLLIVTLLEVVVVAYAYSKVDKFAEASIASLV